MDYSKTASAETIHKTVEALKARGIQAELIADKATALARVKELIPAGASVSSGTSTTLDEIGFTDYLKSGAHPWRNLKEAIAAEKNPAAQIKLRRASALADVYLGSVHAVTEDGEVLIASATGSQLPAYAYSAPTVIWVVGAQKIVPSLHEAMERLTEHVVPLEDRRMKNAGFPGTMLGKILIIKAETPHNQRAVHLIFVSEGLGF
jgi:L-lactate utilization protein LutC